MNPEKLQLQSADGAQINLDMLYQIAPSCFTEARGADGKVRRVVNFDVLRQLLGDATADTGEEFYQFTWPGKAEARREAARSIRKTLRPVPEDSVDWDTTQNLYIEGDNLEVLKLLQKSYMGKVKMIYIDPPYNTGNDFVYNDDFAATTADHDRAEGNTDELGNRYRKNTDSNGRFHSDWCSMIYPRIQLAHSLLSQDGVMFISIDDTEVDNLRKICDMVFGEKNFIANLIWQKKFSRANDATYFSTMHDHILCYARNNKILDNSGWQIGLLPRGNELPAGYANPDNDPRGPWTSVVLSAKSGSQSLLYKITTPSGRICFPPSGRYWGVNKDKFEQLVNDNRIWFGKDGDGTPRLKTFLSEVQDGLRPNTILMHNEVGHNQEGKQEFKQLFGGLGLFDGPKPVRLLEFLTQIANTKQDSIILDFFSGSATTAHAVMKLNAEDGGNRKFIMVQLPEQTEEDSEARKAGYENICEIGKERIRRAGRKIKEEAGLHGQDLDIGFRVFRVDESNMEDVYFQPAALSQDKLDLFLDNVKPDRTDLDLLFGAMLDWGVQLSLPMSKATIDGRDVYTVNEGDLVACFAENITENVIAHIADQSPLRVLFRDSCFKTDADKINIFEQFKQRLGWSDEEAMKNIRVI